jgi:hypothetical protein
MDKDITYLAKDIMFPEAAARRDYYGRHGFGRCLGLDVWGTDGHVRISPINTTGRTTACTIELPRESIPELIWFLRQIYQSPNPTLE